VFVVLFAHFLIRGLVETLPLTPFFPLVLSLAIKIEEERQKLS